VSAILVELAGRYGDAGWLDGALNMHVALGRPLSGSLAASIRALGLRSRPSRAISAYVEAMRARQASLSPAERADLAVIEQLGAAAASA
jgi:hypothetical protein